MFKLDRVGSTTNAAAELRSCALRHGLQSVRTHQGTNATESSLRAVSRPWILHVGTHGFVVPPPQATGAKAWPPPNMGLDFKADVLASRSGLALAGAQQAVAA